MRRAPELDVVEVIWNTIEPILSLPDAANGSQFGSQPDPTGAWGILAIACDQVKRLWS